MTADPATPVESTQRRGFGMARLVLRAVAGAVGAARKAASAIADVLSERRMATPAPVVVRRRHAGRRSRRPVAALVLRTTAGLRRRLEKFIRDSYLDQRPLITLSQACRRYYL